MSVKHVVFLETNARAAIASIETVKTQLGHRVTFITSDLAYYLEGRPLEQTPLRFADRIIEVADGGSVEAVWPHVERLHGEHAIDAFFSFAGIYAAMAASLARRLGVPHLDPEAAHRASNKALARRAMADAGIEQPAFLSVDDTANLDEARAFCRRVGYPLIAKPDDGSSKELVRLIHDDGELAEQAAAVGARAAWGCGRASSKRLLLEEFVTGPLVSVETVTLAPGRHVLLGITDRLVSEPPYFVELGGSFPAAIPGQEAAFELVERALDAIGYDFGPAHTEIILSPDGPRIVEINPRLAGGVVPDMIDATRGGSIFLDVVRLFLGEEVDWRAETRGVATIRAFQAPRRGTLRGVAPSPRASDGRVLRYQIVKKEGDSVRPPQDNLDRLGFLVVLEKDQERSRRLADELLAETLFSIGAGAGGGLS